MTECVRTIEDLRTLVPQNVTCVLVQGYNAPGDEGGGIFFWDYDFPKPEDFGTVIKSKIAPPTGSWRRIVYDSISAKWFGAKGDTQELYEDKDPNKTLRHYKGTVSGSSLILDQKVISNADTGKKIVLWKDGVSGFPFVTSIIGYDPLTKKVALENPVPTSASGVSVAWGTDDWFPIQQAINVAIDTSVAVFLPPGHYLITKTLNYRNFESSRENSGDTYSLMRPGLRLIGAGSQSTFIHNQGRGNPTIRLDADDGTPNKKYFSFQQSGLLKDFAITSIGRIEGTTGIDLRETWGYTIQNIHVSKMASHGIILRNSLSPSGIFPGPNSDGDANDKTCVDNALIYQNGGWGIIVDAENICLSTSRTEIIRSKIEENKLGGIQRVGQTGLIKFCGIYGNGVEPGKKSPSFQAPKGISGAYGILVKNVNATSNGLSITGCEVQGNADVQIMLEVGGNIKINQTDFKSDDIKLEWTFPQIDIQVGDGSPDRSIDNCVIEDNRIRASYGEKSGWGNPASGNPDPARRTHTVVKVNRNAVGTVIGRWWTSQFVNEGNWKLVELVDTNPKVLRMGLSHVKTHLHRGGVDGGHTLLPFASKLIKIDNTPRADIRPPLKPGELTEFEKLINAGIIIGKAGNPEVMFVPDTSQWSCYTLQISGTIEILNLANPTVRVIGSPLFFSFVNFRPVDPNDIKNQITVNFGSDYAAGRGIKLYYGEVISGILLFDERYQWRLYSPWNCNGVPLLGNPQKSTVF